MIFSSGSLRTLSSTGQADHFSSLWPFVLCTRSCMRWGISLHSAMHVFFCTMEVSPNQDFVSRDETEIQIRSRFVSRDETTARHCGTRQTGMAFCRRQAAETVMNFHDADRQQCGAIQTPRVRAALSLPPTKKKNSRAPAGRSEFFNSLGPKSK